MEKEKINMDTAQELRKKAIEIYDTLLSNEAFRKSSAASELIKYADRSYHLLKDYQCNIGIIGVQSSGKTTLMNTLLGYPYLPIAGVTTTCAVTHIKYREKLGIEIEYKNGSHVSIDLDHISEDLFNELKLYACSCIKEYDIEQVNYFIRDFCLDEDHKRIVKPADLEMDYGNVKHRVVLVLNILLFYVDLNADSKLLGQEVLDIIKWREKLLPKLKIKGSEDYKVTFYCDSPILTRGLVFTDLPGLGADVQKGSDGASSHDQITLDEARIVDAVIFIMTPIMSEEDTKPIKDILPIFTGRKITNAENKLIPIVNKIDMIEGGGYKNKVDKLYKECGLFALDSKKTFNISARKAEKRLFDLAQGLFQDQSFSAKALLKSHRTEPEIWEALESNYEESNFDEIYEYIMSYAPKAMAAESLQLMIYMYQELSAFMSREKARLDISGQIKNSGTIAGVRLIGVLENAVQELVTKGHIKLTAASQKLLDNVASNGLSGKAREEIAENFKLMIASEHLSMSQDVKKYGDKLLSSRNFIGDIVLSRKNGQKKEVENIKNWESLQKRVTGEEYNKSFKYFQREVQNIDGQFIEKMIEADKEFIRYMDEFKGLLWDELEKQKKSAVDQAIQGIQSAAKRGRLIGSENYRMAGDVIEYIFENIDVEIWKNDKTALEWILQECGPGHKAEPVLADLPDIPEQDMVSVDTLKTLCVVIDKMKEAYENVRQSINICFTAQNQEIENKRDELLVDAAKKKLDIKAAYNKRNVEFLKSIVEKGVLFSKVELIQSDKLSDALNGKLNLSEEDIKKYDSLIFDMTQKMLGGYMLLVADKNQAISKVWGGLNQNVCALTQDISGQVTYNENLLNDIIKEKKETILSIPAGEGMDGWFGGYSEDKTFFETFSGEIEKVERLHAEIRHIQDEVMS